MQKLLKTQFLSESKFDFYNQCEFLKKEKVIMKNIINEKKNKTKLKFRKIFMWGKKKGMRKRQFIG